MLNDRPAWPKGPELYRPQCDCLQQIIERTGAKIVLTSSWRNWIVDGSMTKIGFARLLQTHGVQGVVISYLREGPVDAKDRAKAIQGWLALRPRCDEAEYVILDDLPLDVSNLIRTDGHVGLTAKHVEQACSILGEKGA